MNLNKIINQTFLCNRLSRLLADNENAFCYKNKAFATHSFPLNKDKREISLRGVALFLLKKKAT